MKAAIRKGWLGFSYAFTDKQPQPIFDEIGKNTNDVLITVKAAAINPVDYKLPRLALGPILGLDCCGYVTEIGDDAKDSGGHAGLKKGDLVYGQAKCGSVAEYTVMSRGKFAVAEGNLWTAVEYAALSVAYQSALQCLRKGGILDGVSGSGDGSGSDRAVLVIGASGGCGVAALQLLEAIGGVSRRVAICSKRNEEFVEETGATEVVDYTNRDELDSFYSANVGRFDMVYDAATNSGAGEDYWKRSIPLLKPSTDVYGGGQYVALNGSPWKWIRRLIGWEKKGQSLLMMKPNSEDLALVVELLNRTGARPITNVVPFDGDGLHQAIDGLKSRRTKGKIVFDVS